MAKCVICGKEMHILDVLKQHEMEVTKVYDKPNCSNRVDITFYYCPLCSHGQIDRVYQETYYQTYELLHNVGDTGVIGNYTQTLLDYYDQMFAELKAYVPRAGSLLDIGCGPGILLKRAMAGYEEGIGVEPSKIQAKYGKEQLNLNILNTYFDGSVEIEDNSMDAFICLQVLEHLENADEVLSTAFRKLKNGGIGFVEVPNGQKIINENRYYDIFVEHINYFSISSLTTLLLKAGFEVIKIGESFGQNFIAAYVRKGKKFTGFTDRKARDKAFVNRLFHKFQNIAVWGVGTKAKNFSLLMEEKQPKYIFDSNKLVWGSYLCNSSIKIVHRRLWGRRRSWPAHRPPPAKAPAGATEREHRPLSG